MGFRIESRHLGDVAVIVPDVYHDERGYFLETYHAAKFRELGLPGEYVQDNQSYSSRGVVRGLHFQWDPPMGKLMRVTFGSAYLVAVDIRRGSATLGRHFGVEVSAANHKLVFAPAGFARGFCVLSEVAEIQYLCTGIYDNRGESGILWNDPALQIDWPVADPVISEKDQKAQTLDQWLSRPEADNFRFGE